MRYVQDFRYSSGLGAIALAVFRGGSIFDPDFSGVGHQPLGHDEYQNFYHHYTVLGAKLTATWSTEGDGVGDQYIVGIGLRADATVTSDVELMRELPGTKWANLGGATSGKNFKTLSKFYSVRKFHDVKDIRDNSQFKAAFGTNPAEDAFFHVFAINQNPIDVGSTINCHVVMTFICVLTEPKNLTKST